MHKLRSLQLKYREKVRNVSSRQIARFVRMAVQSPYASLRHSVIKAMVNLTYRCECACDYCWCGSYEKNAEQELLSSEAERIIDQIAGLPSLATLVSFIGGEPLLRSDIFHLVEYATKKGLFTELETNGIALSESAVVKFKECGLNHIFIKIEGSNRERHDALAKVEGCFDHALRGIAYCLAHGLSCSIFMNASKGKVRNGEIKRIINLARQLKAVSVRIIFPTLAGRWIAQECERLTVDEEIEIQKLLEPNFVYLESSDTCRKDSQRICPALRKEFFHISCYGEIQPCPFVPITFGNIRSETLSEILEKMWQHKIFTARFEGCLMNNSDFRNTYILPHRLETDYRNISLQDERPPFL